MILACIDIGSNTTRLLVAEADGDSLREVVARRAFTRLGASTDAEGRLPADRIEDTARTVEAQMRDARAAGATRVEIVGTAAVREAANRDDLEAAVRARAGEPIRVLDPVEEARLSYVGAARTLPEAVQGPLAVVDVGGGSTELAVGSGPSPEWSTSVRVGSGLLTALHLRSDPPAALELEHARRHVDELFAALAPPQAGTAVAVGGTATSLVRLAGADLDARAMERAVDLLCAIPVAAAAERFELDPQRVRLLPAGILVLQAVSRLLDRPLRVARGGLREGVILEHMDRAGQIEEL